MINLGRCLVYLLERHEQVAVAGIGTFRRVREAGYYDEATRSFHPPSSDISFEADSGTGEGGELVVDYVTAQRRVTRSVAQASYRKSIAAVLSALDADGAASLDGLGTLKQEKEHLTFVPEVPADSAVPKKLPVREWEASSMAEDQMAPPSSVASEQSVPQPLEQTAQTVEGFEATSLSLDQSEGEPRRGGMFWKIAAIVVIVIGTLLALVAYFRPDLTQDLRLRLAAIGSTQPQTSTIPTSQSSPSLVASEPQMNRVSSHLQDSLFLEETVEAPGDTTAQTVDGLSADGVARTAEDDEMEDRPHTGPVVTYEIIVASFRTMEQANSFVAEMKEKGVELRAIDSRQPQNRKKVSWGSYPTKEAAYRELPKVQRTLEPTAWVDRIVRN